GSRIALECNWHFLQSRRRAWDKAHQRMSRGDTSPCSAEWLQFPAGECAARVNNDLSLPAGFRLGNFTRAPWNKIIWNTEPDHGGTELCRGKGPGCCPHSTRQSFCPLC